MTAFLILWVVLFVLAVFGRAIVPTTVQPTKSDTVKAVIWSGIAAAVLTVMFTGLWTLIGGLF